MKVYFVIGCGRSGKTTAARKLADQIPGAVLITEAQFLGKGTINNAIIDCRENGVDLILDGLEYWADGTKTNLPYFVDYLKDYFRYKRDSEPVVRKPYNPHQFCHCCGHQPDIDLKQFGALDKQVDVSRDLYLQVCFEEWERKMGRKPEGRA